MRQQQQRQQQKQKQRQEQKHSRVLTRDTTTLSSFGSRGWGTRRRQEFTNRLAFAGGRGGGGSVRRARLRSRRRRRSRRTWPSRRRPTPTTSATAMRASRATLKSVRLQSSPPEATIVKSAQGRT